MASAPQSNGYTAKPVTIAVVGAGSRGTTYAAYALENPGLARVVAVAEPSRHRCSVFSRKHRQVEHALHGPISEDLQFSNWKGLKAKGRIADAVIIAVQDHQHVEAVEDFAELGYHILCEKPMATSVADCVKIRNLAQATSPNVFGMGHVLRYSPYNRAVKDIIDSGALGEIVNIQHIEPVGNQHFAHSYVRGNWHKEADSSFALMTKSCHDIDIVNFYLSGLTPTKVHSFGSLRHFKKSQKPVEAGSAKRCLECPHEQDCVWSAKKIYIDTLQGDVEKWARHFVDSEVLDIENVTEALNRTNYGTCVYEGENDVVDHQIVNIEYEGGITASVTMSAFTESVCQRGTRIQGTKGELIGDMTTFDVFDFLTRTSKHHTPKLDGGYHGGGDTGLARAFVSAVAEGKQSVLHVTIDDILDSHLLVFAAEKARKESCVVDFGHFKQASLGLKA
ncbi:streptomycin biosynthesis protein StrI [Cordyceps militaris CM01]|uniref:Streptomycin biosynthesis protein StrI n=1 Tax=Cordyceps militaris (strain CM01) TaxID=983644 RepID=G3J9U1_CORMM|nr:streptomycin biosynthesis protein StrI [Cordyceps militaris CM01]EGX95014.1 streptomycin biosynthesis protein StrI [Cordyceps militaris CM01]